MHLKLSMAAGIQISQVRAPRFWLPGLHPPRRPHPHPHLLLHLLFPPLHRNLLHLHPAHLLLLHLLPHHPLHPLRPLPLLLPRQTQYLVVL